MAPVLAILAAGAALSAMMALAWRIQQSTGSSRHVDSFWSIAVGVAGFAVALLPFDGVSWRQGAVAAMILIWGLRLGGHIAGRNRSAADDPRYRDLQLAWGSKAAARMFRFLQGQALVGLVLVLAVALAAHNPAVDMRGWDVAGMALLLLGIGGEALADRQLRLFARNHPGSVCDTGLWAWSRHPNYFFEWLTWCAYPVIAAGSAWGWLALAAPAVMHWALVYASGIPPLEAHMLRSRGAAYRAYRARTSVFFPLPPRRVARG